MDFFACQEKARIYTRLLVLAFITAIISVVGIIDLCIYWYNQCYPINQGRFIDKEQIIIINIIICGTIIFGSLIKYFKFRSGGKSIASMLNATLLDPSSHDPKIIRLINIVAETSIASGIVAPTTYILTEEVGINAFVAGYNPNDTVLVVTQGALDNLSRDEMQGVIAHEFSHIFNSDTVINLRLLTMLGGLLALSQLGYIMIRKDRRNSRPNYIGYFLYLIGSIGLFFASIIKAAIIRKRETLADASAVQYTRNPTGIATALLKIQAQGSAALMKNKEAENINHFCFSKASEINFISLFETHPDIEKRIAMLDPTGTITRNFKDNINKPIIDEPETKKPPLDKGKFVFGTTFAASTILSNIGNPTANSFQQAEHLLNNIPPELYQQLGDIDAAQAIIYAIATNMLDNSIDKLQNLSISPNVKSLLNQYRPMLQTNALANRSTIIALAIPTLRNNLDTNARQQFYNNLHEILSADNNFTLSKALLLAIIKQRLNDRNYQNITFKYNYFAVIKPSIICFMWFLAKHGNTDTAVQQQAFTTALQQFNVTDTAAFSIKYTLHDLINSIENMRFMSPKLKQQFLTACIMCIKQDNIINDDEQEMLRSICICLDCPMPQLA